MIDLAEDLEKEKKLREEFELEFEKSKGFALDKRFFGRVDNKYLFSEIETAWNWYLSATKKAQKETDEIHSFCLDYQIYVKDILSSAGVLKSFHELRKGAYSYALMRKVEPKWKIDENESSKCFDGLVSYVKELKGEVLERNALITLFLNLNNLANSGHITNEVYREMGNKIISRARELLLESEVKPPKDE